MSSPPARISGFRGRRPPAAQRAGRGGGWRRAPGPSAGPAGARSGRWSPGRVSHFQPPYGPQKDRVGGLAHVDGLLGQAGAGGVNGAAVYQDLFGSGRVAELLPHLVQDQEGLLHHVGGRCRPRGSRQVCIPWGYASCLFLMSAIRPFTWMISLMNAGKGGLVGLALGEVGDEAGVKVDGHLVTALDLSLASGHSRMARPMLMALR